MIDCPDVLHSGADLIISLSIYLRASAFKSPNASASASLHGKQSVKAMFNEGHESLEEQILRERKNSMLKLFDVVGLKARAGVDYSKYRDKNDVELHGETVAQTTRAKKTTEVKTEIVGDGEEVEVDDGEDLSENELDMIYKKYAHVHYHLVLSSPINHFLRAQRNDQTMGEMEAPDTFTLTLRGYQKQALL